MAFVVHNPSKFEQRPTVVQIFYAEGLHQLQIDTRTQAVYGIDYPIVKDWCRNLRTEDRDQIHYVLDQQKSI